VQALLAVTATNRLAALFVVAVSTGMRPGKILGLRWPDVDLDVGEIQIQRNIQRVDGVTRSEDTKSENGRRRILLTHRAHSALRVHHQQQREEQAILENQWDNSWNLVFCTRKGKPLHASWLTHRVYEPALREAGLPHIRFYDLRHTAATLLMEAGIHPKVVSEMLGHSSITLTLGTYYRTCMLGRSTKWKRLWQHRSSRHATKSVNCSTSASTSTTRGAANPGRKRNGKGGRPGTRTLNPLIKSQRLRISLLVGYKPTPHLALSILLHVL
jgi:integrase